MLRIVVDCWPKRNKKLFTTTVGRKKNADIKEIKKGGNRMPECGRVIVIHPNWNDNNDTEIRIVI